LWFKKVNPEVSQEIFVVFKRRRGAIAFWIRFVLGWIRCLGFVMFAGCGCLRRYLSLLRLETARKGKSSSSICPNLTE